MAWSFARRKTGWISGKDSLQDVGRALELPPQGGGHGIELARVQEASGQCS